MPRVDDTPKVLRPYFSHGIALGDPDSRGNARGDCPFCGREGKLSVSAETGSAHCWACVINPDAPKGGVNLTTFLRRLWEESAKLTTPEDFEALRADRGFERADVARAWGAARSVTTGEWLLPGRDASMRVCQLYRWEEQRSGGGRILKATPKAGELPGGGIFCGGWDADRGKVMITEGPWDGIALEEAMLRCMPDKAADANVFGVPGCGAVGDLLRAWLPLFKDKDVRLCFDADDAGRQASERAAAILAEVARTVEWRPWPDGMPAAGIKDVRDLLVRGMN